LFSLICGVFLLFLFPLLIPSIYGEEFNTAVGISILLLPGLIIYGLSDVLNQSLRGHGKPLAGIFIKGLGIIMIGIIGIVLSAKIGPKGIAIGYMVGGIINFTGLLFITMKYFKDSSLKQLIFNRDDLYFIYKHIKNINR